jgi:hypothetical protein
VSVECDLVALCVHCELGPKLISGGLMYHPHVRPLSTLPAFLLSLSAGLHDNVSLRLPLAADSLLEGAAEALRTHPLHVDHVAEAVIRSIADETRVGVVDVPTMREWAGLGKGTAGQAAFSS